MLFPVLLSFPKHCESKIETVYVLVYCTVYLMLRKSTIKTPIFVIY